MATIMDRLAEKGLQRLLLVASVMAVYGLSLANGFVWDDKLYTIGNPVYRNGDLRAIFFSLANGVEYQPLRDLTYVLDYLVWGGQPFGFHLSNLLFFILNILAVHCLAGQMAVHCAAAAGRPASRLVPLVTAAVFAVHPLNAEAVNFITCRNVLVSGLFLFVAVILVIKVVEKADGFLPRLYIAALGAFLCAMLSKATAIMLPLLLLAILPLLFPGQMKRIALLLAPFFLVAAGFFVMVKRIAESVGVTGASTIQGKVAIALQISQFYLQKLVYPRVIAIEYTTGFTYKIFSAKVLPSVILIVLLAVLVLVTRRRLPEVAVGIGWYLAALLPVMNFFATTPLVADRYVYLPAFGITFLAVTLADRFCPVRARPAVALSVLALLGMLAVNRTLEWRSDETLWQANIRHFPGHAKSYLNLAAFYFNSGNEEKALGLLAANAKVPWVAAYASYYQGRYFYNRKDFAKARELLQKALDAEVTEALRFLGYIAEQEGDYLSAAQYYNRVLTADEKYEVLERSLVKDRLEQVKKIWLDDYLAGARQRIASNPDDLEARRELAINLDRLGFYREALEQYLSLERGGIKVWQIYQNIANCYYNMNMLPEAVQTYEKALALGAVSDDLYNNLGIAYRRLQMHEKSISVLQQATKQFPNSSYPLYNLGLSFYAAGKKAEARTIFAAVDGKFPEFRDRTAPYLKEPASE